ncbi:MAG TPA: hypothetical protein VG963_23525 [Polyangiaceae bacterium]|nr:hypothetical protein [Polyangiaceae bacterium]
MRRCVLISSFACAVPGFLDEAAVEAKGIAPLAATLARIACVPTSIQQRQPPSTTAPTAR